MNKKITRKDTFIEMYCPSNKGMIGIFKQDLDSLLQAERRKTQERCAKIAEDLMSESKMYYNKHIQDKIAKVIRED